MVAEIRFRSVRYVGFSADECAEYLAGFCEAVVAGEKAISLSVTVVASRELPNNWWELVAVVSYKAWSKELPEWLYCLAGKNAVGDAYTLKLHMVDGRILTDVNVLAVLPATASIEALVGSPFTPRNSYRVADIQTCFIVE